MRPSSKLPLLALVIRAASGCYCGYTVNTTRNGTEQSAIFTEVLETDFLHMKGEGLGWSEMAYTIGTDGRWSMKAETLNIEPNIVPSIFDWSGPGEKGPEPGLALWTRARFTNLTGQTSLTAVDEMFARIGEIETTREHMLYGSFRVAMMTTAEEGTSAAFKFQKRRIIGEDPVEISMEILSKQQQKKNGTVNLAIHTPGNEVEGHDGHVTLDYDKHLLDFIPSTGYNEYRFDWLPNRIDFYTNGKLLKSMTENVPNVEGRIILTHWFNGHPGWSGGPPDNDAALRISYFKAYFNDSRTDTTLSSLEHCNPKTPVCRVPNQEIPPNPLGPDGNVTGKTGFWTDQRQGLFYHIPGPYPTTKKKSEAAGRSIGWCGLLMAVWVLAGF